MSEQKLNLYKRRGVLLSRGSNIQSVMQKQSRGEPFPNVLEYNNRVIKLENKIKCQLHWDIWKGLLDGNIEVEVKLLQTFDQKIVKDFFDEAAILKKVSHKNISFLLGEICGPPTYLVRELLSNGNLHEYLIKKSENKMLLSNIIDMATDISEGLEYLHMKAIVHRDIRAVNIQVGSEKLCKISNFEMAKVTTNGIYKARADEKYAVKWTAPEAAVDCLYSRNSDVWSFGILLTEMLTYGDIPYHCFLNHEVLKLLQQGYRMPKPVTVPECPDTLYRLMLQCWQEEPNERPLIGDIKIFLREFFNITEPDYKTQFEEIFESEGKRIEITEKLRKGTANEIWKGLVDGLEVCVKKPHSRSRTECEVLYEAFLRTDLFHDNIVQLLWVSTTPPYLVSEYFGGGNLLQFLQKGKGKYISLQDQIKMAADVADGLDFIGQNKIVHRNVRATSVVMSDTFECKITDFHLAKIMKNGIFQIPVPKFVNRWMSPEAGLNGTFSIKSDVWSFGVLLAEILTKGQTPYPDMDEEEVVLKTSKGYRMPKPQPQSPQGPYPDSLYTLMLSCWEKEPKQRATFHYIQLFLKKYFTQIEVTYNEESVKSFEIDINDLIFYTKLKAEANYEIWKGRYKESIVSAKTVSNHASTIKKFQKEVQLLKLFSHENVIYLHGVVSSANTYCIVTEYVLEETLLDHLRNASKRINHKEKMNIMIQIAKGMDYVGKQNVVHCDLRAANISITENRTYKISNFCIAALMDDGKYFATEGDQFPVRWTAPEASLGGLFTVKSDVWSYGVLLWEVMSRGKLPYAGIINRKILNEIESGYRMAKPLCIPPCPDQVYELMLLCWHRVSIRRPTFEFIEEYLEDCENSHATEPRYIDLESKDWHKQLLWTDEEDIYFYRNHESNAEANQQPTTNDGIKPHNYREITLKTKNIIEWLSHMCFKEMNISLLSTCHGNLLQFMKEGPGKHFSIEKQILQAIDITSGLAFLSENKILHRDLRACNIVVSKNFTCKVSGFDAAILVDDVFCRRCTDFKCPIRWQAIEVALNRCFTLKADVWSFGILLTEIVTKGKLPYPDLLDWEIIEKLSEGYRMTKPMMSHPVQTCPECLYLVMTQCWNEDIDERPMFDELTAYFKKLSINPTVIKEVHISKETVKLGKVLEDGKYYQICTGIFNIHTNVTIKQYKVDKVTEEEINCEAEIISSLRHDKILSFLGLICSNNHKWMVVEERNFNFLSNFLSSNKPNIKMQLHIAKQIANGMEYIESKEFVLRALKPDGVWINDFHVCKIAQFKWAKRLVDGNFKPQTVKEKLPARRIAPEALKNKGYSSKSDVWSYAVMFMEIVTNGKQPYSEMSNTEVISAVKSGYYMPKPSSEETNCSESLYNLMVKCWNSEPTKRPDFNYLQDFLDRELERL